MACITSDATRLGVDFNAEKGKMVQLAVKSLGAGAPPMNVAFASYGGKDITATLQLTAIVAIHGLIVVPVCPVDGTLGGLFEVCPAAGEKLLKRFRFRASDPRRVFVVEGV